MRDVSNNSNGIISPEGIVLDSMLPALKRRKEKEKEKKREEKRKRRKEEKMRRGREE